MYSHLTIVGHTVKWEICRRFCADTNIRKREYGAAHTNAILISWIGIDVTAVDFVTAPIVSLSVDIPPKCC